MVAAGFVVPPEVEVPVLGFSVLVGSLVVLSFLSVLSAGVAVGAGVAVTLCLEPQPDFGSWSHPSSSYRWCFSFLAAGQRNRNRSSQGYSNDSFRCTYSPFHDKPPRIIK
ncbi:hypothetical protein NIA69_16705 [Gemmiger formicilis]|nr:hypothetical protein [Gemmiger formicilis]